MNSGAVLPLAAAEANAPVQHFRHSPRSEKRPSHPCVLPRTCDRGQSITKIHCSTEKATNSGKEKHE